MSQRNGHAQDEWAPDERADAWEGDFASNPALPPPSAGHWVTVEALQRFIGAQTEAHRPHHPQQQLQLIRSPGQRMRASERAEKRLADLGI